MECYVLTNGRIATKLAHDGLRVSVHPGCAQGQGQDQRSRDTRTFLDSWNELLRHWRSGLYLARFCLSSDRLKCGTQYSHLLKSEDVYPFARVTTEGQLYVKRIKRVWLQSTELGRHEFAWHLQKLQLGWQKTGHRGQCHVDAKC